MQNEKHHRGCILLFFFSYPGRLQQQEAEEDGMVSLNGFGSRRGVVQPQALHKSGRKHEEEGYGESPTCDDSMKQRAGKAVAAQEIPKIIDTPASHGGSHQMPASAS